MNALKFASLAFAAAFALAAPLVSAAGLVDEVQARGEVVSLTPGASIAVRGSDGAVTVYTLAPTAMLPPKIAVGSTVRFAATQNGQVWTLSRFEPDVVERSAAISPTALGAVTTAINGEITVFETGKRIVVRESSGEKRTFTLGPASRIPAGLAVGNRVMVTSEERAMGDPMAARIVIEGSSEVPQPSSLTTTTTINGVVHSVEPGGALVLESSDGTTTTYTLREDSRVPEGLAKGQRIIVTTKVVEDLEDPVVDTIVVATDEPAPVVKKTVVKKKTTKKSN